MDAVRERNVALEMGAELHRQHHIPCQCKSGSVQKHNTHVQVRGRMAAVHEDVVELETGAELPFDYLILAPGNNIKDVGGTAAERTALIEVRSIRCRRSMLLRAGKHCRQCMVS